VNGVPFREWLVNVVLCLAVLAAASAIGQALERRRLWNVLMTAGSLLFVLLVRFRDPLVRAVPVAVFAVGAWVALGHTRLNGSMARAVGTAAVTALWFGLVFGYVLTVVFYFCAGCFV
jgi:hypothetical protein